MRIASFPLLALVTACATVARSTPGTIRWAASYPEAAAQAKAQGKLLFVDFYVPG